MKKLILLTTLLSTAVLSFGQVPAAERDALIAFYDSTDGPNWTNNTNWNTTEPVSTWFGITVTNISDQDHVTAISLNNNNLNGTLAPEIGDLTELTGIEITFNSLLTGNIPTELGLLLNLEALNFWDNDLTGSIPTEIGNCTNLSLLSLEDNNLIGNIPESFSNLTLMGSFWVNGNQLSGEFPDIISSWPGLFYFSIGDINNSGSFNNFSGSLDFSNNPEMIIYWIENNDISSLNVQNGNNINTSNGQFSTSNNPNLTCITVDDSIYSSETWTTSIDPTQIFLETVVDCSVFLDIDDLSFESSIVMYPNPTNGIINITNSGEADIKEIVIINSFGQIITKTGVNENINLSNFPSGIYLLSIESTKGLKANYKIMKR